MMSTLTVIEQRKFDLRKELVRSVRACGYTDPKTLQIYHKLQEMKRAQAYLRRAA